MASASWAWPAVKACGALRLQSEATVVPSSPYRFWGPRFLHFPEKNSLVGARPLLAAVSCFLLGLVPAGKELLRCLLVAPLHLPHARNVVGILVPVLERARLPPLNERGSHPSWNRRRWLGRLWLRASLGLWTE